MEGRQGDACSDWRGGGWGCPHPHPQGLVRLCSHPQRSNGALSPQEPTPGYLEGRPEGHRLPGPEKARFSPHPLQWGPSTTSCPSAATRWPRSRFRHGLGFETQPSDPSSPPSLSALSTYHLNYYVLHTLLFKSTHVFYLASSIKSQV